MPRTKQFDEEKVLEKAMLLFWEKGYFNTSIEDLVNRLGINRASLYHAFGGKRKLFTQALELYRRTNFQGMSAFLGTQEDVRAGIRSIFDKITTDDLTDAARKGCFIVNTTTELLPADAEIQEVLAEHKQRVETTFYTFLQKGVDRGQISPDKDIKTISILLYTLMTGIRVNGKFKPARAESMASLEAVLTLLD